MTELVRSHRLPRAKRSGVTSVSCLPELIAVCAAEPSFLRTALERELEAKEIKHVRKALLLVAWLSRELLSLQIEEVVLSLPLVSLSWEVSITEEEQALPLSSKGTKDGWLCVPCGAECVVEVVLERSCLKKVNLYRRKLCP